MTLADQAPAQPWTLRPYQLDALRSIRNAWNERREALLVLATGLGKCLARGTPVLMFDGSSRPVECVRAGDLVMGPDSAPRRVTSLARGVDLMYRVTPTKGDSYVVNSAHILSVVISGDRPVNLHGRRCQPGAVVNLSVSDWMSASRTFRHVAKGWRSAVDFAPRALHHDMPPYILGMWLGDGTSRGPSITSADDEVVEAFSAYASARGMSIRKGGGPDKCAVYHATTCARSGRGHRTNRMLNALRDLGVLGNKHVPHAYATASREDRLELLAGLMDTDGSAVDGCYDFISKHRHISESVCFVARSLGLSAYLTECEKMCVNNGVVGTYYRVCISGNCSMIPCRIARKRMCARRQKKVVTRVGIRVEPVGTGEYYGFTLDGPDRLFLLGDFTVTHNTTVFAEVLRRRRDAGRGRALVLAHRIELLEQAAERIRLAGISCDLESGEMRAPKMALAGQSEVVIATVQSMRGKRLQSWHPQTFTTIVIDEAHHSTAAGYRAVIDYFADAKVLGVTATPDRGDEVALGHIYGPEPVFSYGIVEGINGGYLSRIRSLSIDMPSLDLSSVRVTKQEHGRDLNADDLSRQMKAERALHEIARPFADKYEGRQSIIFTPSVEVAHALSSVLTPYIGPGLVSSLDGSSPKDERKRVLDAYKRGDIRVLVNCALFTEGFDAPATSVVAIARPTKSRALYAQMVGRGTRIHPGKEDLLVLNFEPRNEAHTLVSPIDLMAGEDLPEAVLEAAKASGDADSLRALSNAKEAAQKRMEAQERDRQRAKLVADAKYRVRQTDPFAELGIDGELGRDRGPRATDRQREALESIGFKLGNVVPSRREAAGLLDEVTKRRTKGLCTIKQMRQLARFGLRTDLTFAEAGQAMTALADAGWKVTPGIADRFGGE